jgi:ribonuclease PH
MRVDGRSEKQLRKIEVIKDYTMHAEGSVLYCQGNTKVICTATVEESVPPYMLGTGKGWVTA